MADTEQRPDGYALLTAGSAVFGVVLAFSSAPPFAKAAGLVFMFLAMTIIVSTHLAEFRAAIHDRRLTWRTSTVLLVLALLSVATLSSLPAFFGDKGAAAGTPTTGPATLAPPRPRLPRDFPGRKISA